MTSLLEFEVDCPEAGTSAEGTFFILQNKDSVNMKIVINLIVGNADEEGLEIFIPAELDIKNVLCSFNGDISTKYAVIRDWPGGGHFVYVDKLRYSSDGSPIGGHGTVIVELNSNEKIFNEVDSLDFQITVANKVVKDIAIPISY